MNPLNMQSLIESYVRSKQNAWSPATQRSERYRLAGLTEEHLKEPTKLYEFLTKERNLKPYAVRTAFVRVGELLKYAMDEGLLPHGPNKVKDYMQAHAQQFKHSYRKKEVDLSFEAAVERIKKIADKESQKKAIQLLYAGMRWGESNTLKDGQVIAKGGGTRDVPLAQGMEELDYKKDYSTFYRHLKKVGLTPHALRKLCATKAVELGADVADLMKLFGWTNSNTAMKYVQAQKTKQLADRFHAMLPKEESKNGE